MLLLETPSDKYMINVYSILWKVCWKDTMVYQTCDNSNRKGTIFAYGQTGTGKTFTMSGVPADPQLRGVIPNSFQHIFDRISTAQNNNTTFLVRASFLELYNEETRDLLGQDPEKKLELKEHPEKGVYVKDLSSCIHCNCYIIHWSDIVKSIPEMESYMDQGSMNRHVASTNMNDQSSRSHSVSQILPAFATLWILYYTPMFFK